MPSNCDYADLVGDVPPILAALDSLPRWVPWRLKDGQKLAVRPSGHKARSNVPGDWATRGEATARARQLGDAAKVGLVLGPNAPGPCVGGVDLDGAIDPDDLSDHTLHPWARAILDRFPSYAEISPSGTGLKLLFVYDPADLKRIRKAFPTAAGGDWGPSFAVEHVGPEIHLGGRWYAITGRRWPDAPAAIRPVALESLLWLLEEHGPAVKAAQKSGGGKVDRSGQLHSIGRRMHRAGETFDAFTAAVKADPDAWGHVLDNAKGSARQRRLLERQWERAGEKEAARLADFEAQLEDLPEKESPAAADKPADSPIVDMNRRHAVLPVGGHERILTLRGRQDYSIGTAEDLRLRYKPKRVRVGDSPKPLADVWLSSRNRRAYPDGLTFLPGRAAPAGTFNTWRAWAVEPDTLPQPEERCPRILEHLGLVFGEHATWGFDWLAHMLQRPWEKPGTTVILRGDEGVGKDIPADYLGKILGLHCTVVADPKHLTGAFNAHMARAVLVHATDSVWGGDRAAGGKLRAMVTQTKLPLEHKGQDVVTVDSFARFWISTNAEWAIEAARESRRWFVVEVPGDHKGDRAYFNALAAEMDGGGPAALLAWLLARDIESDLRQAPETAALGRQRLESLRGPEAWIAASVEAGEILGANSYHFGSDTWPDDAVPATWLREACETWLRGARHRGDMARPEVFGRILTPYTDGGLMKLPRNGSKTQPRGYRLRAVEECKCILAKLYGTGVA